VAVAHDTSNTRTLAAVTTISWSHTASGSNRLATAGFGAGGASIPAITAATYGGAAMTQSGTLSDGSAGVRVSIYHYIAPATSSQTIQFDFSTAAYGCAGSVSFTGVDQTTPTGTAATNTAAGTTSVTVTAGGVAADDMVLDCVKDYTGIPVVGADQTERWNGNDGTFGEYAAGSTQLGTAGGAMSWTRTPAPDNWTIVAVAIKAAAAGGVVGPLLAGHLLGRGILGGRLI
jgi:hypothetical protein